MLSFIMALAIHLLGCAAKAQTRLIVNTDALKGVVSQLCVTSLVTSTVLRVKKSRFKHLRFKTAFFLHKIVTYNELPDYISVSIEEHPKYKMRTNFIFYYCEFFRLSGHYPVGRNMTVFFYLSLK